MEYFENASTMSNEQGKAVDGVKARRCGVGITSMKSMVNGVLGKSVGRLERLWVRLMEIRRLVAKPS